MSEDVHDRAVAGAATTAAVGRVAGAPGAPPAGWYPDPWRSGWHRFWGGEGWTADTFPDGPAGPGPAVSGQGTASLAAHSANTPAHPVAQPSSSVFGPATGAPPPPQWSAPSGPADRQAQPPPPDTSPAAAQLGGPRRWPPRGRALVAMLLVVSFAVGLVGGRLLSGRRRSTTPVSSPTPPQALAPAPPGLNPATPGTPATPADPGASVLAGLVVRLGDVAPTVTVGPIVGGTRVAGEATLDLCNGTYPSESRRTARLQVAAVDPQGAETISTEAVLYSNPAGAAQAFSELKSTAANCPAAPVTSPVGEPTVTTHFNPAPDGSWPPVTTVDRLAFDFVTTDASAQTQHATAVYLRRGRVLMGVYFSRTGAQTAIEGQTTIAGIVNVFATRMEHLSATVVNGG